MQEGGAGRKPRQPLGILGGLNIGATNTHEGGDLLNSWGGRGLRLKAQRPIGWVAVTVASRTGAVRACEVERTQDRIDTPHPVFGFDPQGFLAVVTHERLESGQSMCGGTQDREHKFPGLSLQEFFEMAESDARGLEQGGEGSLCGLGPRTENVLRDEVGVD